MGIYVQDGMTSPATIYGAITAAELTKFGPGTLLLSNTSGVPSLLTSTSGAGVAHARHDLRQQHYSGPAAHHGQ